MTLQSFHILQHPRRKYASDFVELEDEWSQNHKLMILKFWLELELSHLNQNQSLKIPKKMSQVRYFRTKMRLTWWILSQILILTSSNNHTQKSLYKASNEKSNQKFKIKPINRKSQNTLYLSTWPKLDQNQTLFQAKQNLFKQRKRTTIKWFLVETSTPPSTNDFSSHLQWAIKMNSQLWVRPCFDPHLKIHSQTPNSFRLSINFLIRNLTVRIDTTKLRE